MELKEFCLDDTTRIITRANSDLNFSFRTRCKALKIYHQFKSCCGKQYYDSNLLSAACINLSTKINKENIDLDEIIMMFCSMLFQPIEKYSKEYYDIKKSVRTMEIIILRMVEFDIDHHLAHEFLVYFLFDIHQELQSLNLWNVIFEQCMKIVSDFHLTSKCLDYAAEELAACSIYASFYLSGIDIETHELGRLKKWLERLTPIPNKEAILEDIFKICLVSPAAEAKVPLNMSLNV